MAGLYAFRFTSNRIDDRLFTKHGKEVMRLSGRGMSGIDNQNYWIRFLLQQSIRQLGDPELNKLVFFGVASILWVVIAFGLLFIQ